MRRESKGLFLRMMYDMRRKVQVQLIHRKVELNEGGVKIVGQMYKKEKKYKFLRNCNFEDRLFQATRFFTVRSEQVVCSLADGAGELSVKQSVDEDYVRGVCRIHSTAPIFFFRASF